MTIEEFADRWMANPLFDGTSPEAARWWREDLLRNDPIALAEVLRRIGAGAMAPLWDRIGALTMPVTIVVGGRDGKFVRLAERLRGAPAAGRDPRGRRRGPRPAARGAAELAALIEGAGE